jgi:hypothetical protein
MNIQSHLRNITALGIGITAVSILVLAACGGGSGGGGAPSTHGFVSTVAGTSGSYGYTDGIGATARFITPSYVASDGTNLYVTDSWANNIRKIVIATGEVSTLAGSSTGASGLTDARGTAARFNRPLGIATDGINAYVADSGNNSIRRIVISTGAVTTVACSLDVIPGTADGAGTAARFSSPWGISLIGNALYVGDGANSTIRRIDLGANVQVSTIAGTAGNPGWNDSPAGAAATFNLPTGLAASGGTLFAAELENCDVRRVIPATGETMTLAGSAASGVGSADGTGASARFNHPYGITSDGANLYVTDTWNNTIRKIVIATGAVTTLAGTAGAAGSTDAYGSDARFYFPQGIVYVSGALYIADSVYGTIRRLQL